MKRKRATLEKEIEEAGGVVLDWIPSESFVPLKHKETEWRGFVAYIKTKDRLYIPSSAGVAIIKSLDSAVIKNSTLVPENHCVYCGETSEVLYEKVIGDYFCEACGEYQQTDFPFWVRQKIASLSSTLSTLEDVQVSDAKFSNFLVFLGDFRWTAYYTDESNGRIRVAIPVFTDEGLYYIIAWVASSDVTTPAEYTSKKDDLSERRDSND